MERVNITIGPLSFDHADYDAENDVLYLHVGAPETAEGEETPEGHVIRYAPGTNRVVGLTVLGARRVLEHDGRLTVTVPEIVETTAEQSCSSACCRLDRTSDRPGRSVRSQTPAKSGARLGFGSLGELRRIDGRLLHRPLQDRCVTATYVGFMRAKLQGRPRRLQIWNSRLPGQHPGAPTRVSAILPRPADSATGEERPSYRRR